MKKEHTAQIVIVLTQKQNVVKPWIITTDKLKIDSHIIVEKIIPIVDK
jgi:hypothetical protein